MRIYIIKLPLAIYYNNSTQQAEKLSPESPLTLYFFIHKEDKWYSDVLQHAQTYSITHTGCQYLRSIFCLTILLLQRSLNFAKMIPYCMRNVKVQALERPVHAWYCFIMFIYLVFSIKACRKSGEKIFFLKIQESPALTKQRMNKWVWLRILHNTVNSNHHLKFSNCD